MKDLIEEIEGAIFHIYIHEEQEEQILLESKTKGTQLTGTYSYIKHQPHNPNGEYHLHVYNSSIEIFAINQSGIAHDGYHGIRIPNKVYKALIAKFPNWNFPEIQLIESINYINMTNFGNQILRPVQVQAHQNESLNSVREFKGLFHRFADAPFLTGSGYFAKTVAIIEDMEGRISKVPVESFKFTDNE